MALQILDDIQQFKEEMKMKFDFCIGNPPYQNSVDTYNRQEPIYPFFYDSAESVADKYILISPARFLFNAGLTPKEWNQKMLDDSHLKVASYMPDASVVFPNTEIKGGVVVVYRDKSKDFGAIGEFIPDESLRGIASHFRRDIRKNLPAIMYGGRSDLKFNNAFLTDYPESPSIRLKEIQRKHPEASELAPNEEYELKSSTLSTLSYVFKESPTTKNSDYYKILGIVGGKRVYRYIEKKYMEPRYPEHNNINNYKVMFPEANGNGVFGEVLSAPVIAGPSETATPSFISIGCFGSRKEVENVLKYTKTKLVRALLGILKTTQHTAPPNWAYVPQQDFGTTSDIDWSVSIKEIDQQLYKKYGLSNEEIMFIESHVKEMA